MGKRAENLSGRRFDMLVVEGRAGGNKQALWACRCDCGATCIARGDHLRDGNKRSCGCSRLRLMSESKRRHGHASGETLTPTYRAWMGMRRRCYDESRHNYANWGGRGITVCDRWRDSFENFLADMGEKPGSRYSLDRIDNDGNYEPGNCRWATWSEQASNRRAASR